MKISDVDTCAFCPRLCRHVCPIAVGSGREAATPTAMMTGVWSWLAGHADGDLAHASASLCTSCGACTAACKLDRPVADLLSEARRLTRPSPTAPPVPAVEGTGRLVAVETDERRWAEALAECVGEPVARMRAPYELGELLLDHPEMLAAHGRRLGAAIGARTLVIASGGAWKVACSLGLDARHLHALLPVPGEALFFHPCSGPIPEGPVCPDSLACCGAAGPLVHVHPAIADDVGREAAARLGKDRLVTSDARCARWLRKHGARVTGPIDRLLAPEETSTPCRPEPD